VKNDVPALRDVEGLIARGLDAAYRVKSSGYLGGNIEAKVRAAIVEVLSALASSPSQEQAPQVAVGGSLPNTRIRQSSAPSGAPVLSSLPDAPGRDARASQEQINGRSAVLAGDSATARGAAVHDAVRVASPGRDEPWRLIDWERVAASYSEAIQPVLREATAAVHKPFFRGVHDGTTWRAVLTIGDARRLVEAFAPNAAPSVSAPSKAGRDEPGIEARWQPIETAPKLDGRLVLLYPSRCWSEDVNTDCEVGYWDAAYGDWVAMGPCAEDYTGPTHWMSLPNPPEVQSSDGGR